MESSALKTSGLFVSAYNDHRCEAPTIWLPTFSGLCIAFAFERLYSEII